MSKAAVVEGTSQGEAVVERALSAPQRAVQFLEDTRAEMRKVVTPSREEVRTNTLIVIVTVFLFAAYFLLIDQTVGRAIDKALLWLTRH